MSEVCYYDEDGAIILVRKPPFGWVFICPSCGATKKLPTIAQVRNWAQEHIREDGRKVLTVLEELLSLEKEMIKE